MNYGFTLKEETVLLGWVLDDVDLPPFELWNPNLKLSPIENVFLSTHNALTKGDRGVMVNKQISNLYPTHIVEFI